VPKIPNGVFLGQTATVWSRPWTWEYKRLSRTVPAVSGRKTANFF